MRSFWAFAFAIVLGTLGGVAFAALGLPLPWMLGSMLFCLLATLLGGSASIPARVRAPMTAIIGTMLGTTFAPGILSQLAGSVIPLAGLLVFLAISGLVSIRYFRLIGYDHKTAYFAGMPGGIVEMVLLGEQAGADTRTIALVHAARVVLVIFAVPFLVQTLTGQTLGTGVGTAVSILGMTPATVLWFAVTSVAGAYLGHILRLPAKYFLGPMLLSALVHGAGWTDFRPPSELVIAAQVVIGASIGCRFAGVRTREILTILASSLGSVALQVVLTCAFAWVVAQFSAMSMIELLLAYSPGGMAEMGLIALSLNIDAALITAHHIVRVTLVSFGAAFLMPSMGVGRKPAFRPD